MADSDVGWIMMLNAGEQPPRAAWAKLIAELRSAGAELTGGKPVSSHLPPGMVSVLRALAALNDYVNASPVAKADPRISVPLPRLMAAIYKSQLAPILAAETPRADEEKSETASG